MIAYDAVSSAARQFLQKNNGTICSNPAFDMKVAAAAFSGCDLNLWTDAIIWGHDRHSKHRSSAFWSLAGSALWQPKAARFWFWASLHSNCTSHHLLLPPPPPLYVSSTAIECVECVTRVCKCMCASAGVSFTPLLLCFWCLVPAIRAQGGVRGTGRNKCSEAPSPALSRSIGGY